jgi:GNAT superfamily N-acetyltransferase
VTGVYTIPAWRRRGVARRLVAACLDEARAWRVRRVWLRTSAAGRPVYEGMGFTDPGNYLQLDLD